MAEQKQTSQQTNQQAETKTRRMAVLRSGRHYNRAGKVFERDQPKEVSAKEEDALRQNALMPFTVQAGNEVTTEYRCQFEFYDEVVSDEDAPRTRSRG